MPHRQHRLARVSLALCVVLAPALPGCGESDTAPPGPIADASAEEVANTVCAPQSCATLGAECGSAPDGCGGKVDCGTCKAGERCGGGGPNRCGTNPCYPKTCTQVGASCGFASDGCSEAIACGNCPAPKVCGGSGVANQCGCRPKTCAALGANCGSAPDECGGAIECGACPAGQLCGGAGKNRCGTGTCSPQTCTQLEASCGFVSDQCSRAVDCGECSGGEVCGGNGLSNRCSCLPKTCGQLTASCGVAQNGCGTDINCGGCPTGESCGLEKPNQCSGSAGAGGSAGQGGSGGSGGTGGAGCAVPPPPSCPSASGGPPLVPVCGGYCLDATEVTRDQYAAWLATNPPTSGQDTWCSTNSTFLPDATCMTHLSVCQGDLCGTHPQVCVDWCDAIAYCRGVGKRLCGKIGGGTLLYTDWTDATKGQWFNACSAGNENDYPYGDTYSIPACNGDQQLETTVPVGSYAACISTVEGYEGVFDLSGNVWEWEDSCDAFDGNSTNCCRLRGGCDWSIPALLKCGAASCMKRLVPDASTGFRCCSDP